MQSPQPPEANEGLGAEPLTLQRFSSFFQKIKHFYGGLNYCLETFFLNDCKVRYCCVLKAFAENSVTAFPKNNSFLNKF